MEQSILQTKLFIPQGRTHFVPRTRLLDRLGKGLDRKLTLVSAPAGFGKTTLVAAWAHHLQSEGKTANFCWLSLDSADSDPVRFLTYFIAALQTAVSHIGQRAQIGLQSLQPSLTEPILTQLINESIQLSHQIILVLDDYHVVHSKPVHDIVRFIINHAPPQLHLVLTTRAEPPLPLSRYRARGQLSELRAVDLRFSREETAVFLQNHSGNSLTPEQITHLDQKAEGWAAGLQMMMHMFNHAQQEPAQLLPAIKGSQDTIFAYLGDEVLKQQSSRKRAFLLQTSILSQLSADLCQAVIISHDAASPHSKAALSDLIQNNLFIVPLDAKGEWFRYHHLFRQFLQTRLETEMAENIPKLHKRACNWYRKRPFPALAIQHALASQDEAYAITVIAEQSDSLLRNGNAGTLVQAARSLSEGWTVHQPSLALSVILGLALQGEVGEAQITLTALWPHLQPNQLGAAYVIQTEISRRQNDLPQMLAAAKQAHAYLDPSSAPLTQLLGTNLADIYAFRLGKSDAAHEILLKLYAQLRHSKQPYLFFHVTNLFAATYALQGQLQAAHDLYQHVLQLGEAWETTSLLGAIYAGLGKILLEWDDLDTAEKYLRAGLKACQQMQAVTPLISNAIALARLLVVKGKQDQAEQLLRETQQIALENPTHLPRLTHWQQWRQADNGWISIAVTATHIVDPQLESIDYSTLFAHLKHIQIEVSQMAHNGRLLTQAAQLENRLNTLYTLAEQANQLDTCLDIKLTQAVLAFRTGETAVAQTQLIKALSLARPHGYLRLFLDFDPALPHLLKQCYRLNNIATDLKSFLRRILSIQSISLSDETVIEPLTPREKDVLHLLGQGLTNQAIANDLHLTVGTVRWHARNIYSKLDVRNRTQAVARARDLHLLP